MSDPNLPSDVPMPAPGDPVKKSESPAPVPPPKAVRKKRWGRRIAIGFLLILVLIGGLILLAPTIAGTGPVRRAVLGKLNEKLNGSIEIQNWSLGWTGGLRVDGIKIFDDRKAEILSVAHLRTELSLLDAMRGRFHCGETVIDEPNLEQLIIYPDGSNNFQKLLKRSPGVTSEPRAERKSEPSKEVTKGSPEVAKKEADGSKPLDVRGHFSVNRLRGFIQDQRAGEPIIIAPESSMSVKINTLKDPIENALVLVYRVGNNGLPGTIKLGGTSQSGDQGTIDEKLELASVSLVGMNPFLAMAGQKITLGGVANGAIAIKAGGANPFSTEGRITTDQFTAGGEMLQGETYSTAKLIVPLKISSTSTDPKTARLKIESLGVQTDQATLALRGDFSPTALENAIHGKSPGSEGQLTLSIHVPNAKPIADQLPKTLHLQDGVKLASGQLFHETNIWLKSDKTVVESKTDISDITGTNKGKPIALSPIHQTTDVTLLPGAMAMPDLHDLAITLVSGFSTVHGGGKTLANLDLAGNLDLPKMQKELGQIVDFGKVDLGGTADFAIRTAGDPTLTGGAIQWDVNATVAHLKMGGRDTAATTQPLPPLQVTSATAHVKVSIARDQTAGKTNITDGQMTVNHLALERGESKYTSADDAVAIQFAGELDGAEKVHGLKISTLSGNFFGGALKMPEPLVVSGLSGAVNAGGAVELSGKIADITRLLETLQATADGKGYPYQGEYKLAERVATKGDVITVTGDGGITDFKVNDAASHQPVFTEKQVTFINNLGYDTRLKNLNISNLKLDMSGSDALHLTVGGSVRDLGGRQIFDQVKVTLGYDLEKVWTIVYPMLTPQQQKDFKDAQVNGKFEKVFAVAGSYPAGKLFNEAIRFLKLNGSLEVGRFNAMGIDLAKLDLPLSLEGGKLRFVFADRPENQQMPSPASLNGGQLNLGGAVLDLNGKELRLTTPKDWKLITRATINPLLGDNLGKYINPVFANSQRAAGLLDVTFAYCEAVAFGDALKTAESGKAKVLFSITEMDIANPLGSQMIGGLTKAIPSNLMGLLGNGKGLNSNGSGSAAPAQSDAFQGRIEGAVVTLDQGVTTQDITLQLADPTSNGPAADQPAGARNPPMLLHFKGDIRLATLQQNLNVTFPTELLSKFIRNKGVGKTLTDIFPAGIPLSLKGTTIKPQLDLGGITKQLVEGFTQANLKSITGGKGEKNGDALGGLLDALGGKKKNKDK